VREVLPAHVALPGRAQPSQGRRAAEDAVGSSQQVYPLRRVGQAKSLELRVATCLVRLRRNQSRRADILAPVFGWFTEGFDTPI
jgi:hypothetical protein